MVVWISSHPSIHQSISFNGSWMDINIPCWYREIPMISSEAFSRTALPGRWPCKCSSALKRWGSDWVWWVTTAPSMRHQASETGCGRKIRKDWLGDFLGIFFGDWLGFNGLWPSTIGIGIYEDFSAIYSDLMGFSHQQQWILIWRYLTRI